MRKGKLMLLCGLCMVMCCACGTKQNDTASNTQTETQQLQETEKTETQADTQIDDTQNDPTYGTSGPYETKDANTLTYGTEGDAFFSDAVFVGDSVMMGFEWYVNRQPEGFLGGPKFFTCGNFGLRRALMPVTDESIHPTYQGQKMLVEDAVAKMGVKKVFMFFGLNDMGVDTPENNAARYQQIIDNVTAKNPDVEIYVISATTLLAGQEDGILNNANMLYYDELTKEMCYKNGYHYVDLVSYLMLPDGSLRPEFCSDGQMHHNELCYMEWVKVLEAYGIAHMNN